MFLFTYQRMSGGYNSMGRTGRCNDSWIHPLFLGFICFDVVLFSTCSSTTTLWVSGPCRMGRMRKFHNKDQSLVSSSVCLLVGNLGLRMKLSLTQYKLSLIIYIT